MNSTYENPSEKDLIRLQKRLGLEVLPTRNGKTLKDGKSEDGYFGLMVFALAMTLISGFILLFV